MKGNLSLFIFFLVKIVHFSCCETGNIFGFRGNGNLEMRNPDLSEGKPFVFGNNEMPQNDKNFGNWFPYFGENVRDMNAQTSQSNVEGYAQQNTEFNSKRINNYGESESVPGTPEQYQLFTSNNGNKPSGQGMDGSRDVERTQSEEVFKGQDSFVKYDVETKSQEAQTQINNGRTVNGYPNGFQNGYSDVRYENNYDRRIPMTPIFNNGNRNTNAYSNDGMVSSMGPRYQNSGMNYNSGIRGNFKTPDFYTADKGVVINFNSDCSGYKNPNHHHMMHKYAYMPTSYLSGVTQVPTYEIPSSTLSTLITSKHLVAPFYNSQDRLMNYNK